MKAGAGKKQFAVNLISFLLTAPLPARQPAFPGLKLSDKAAAKRAL